MTTKRTFIKDTDIVIKLEVDRDYVYFKLYDGDDRFSLSADVPFYSKKRDPRSLARERDKAVARFMQLRAAIDEAIDQTCQVFDRQAREWEQESIVKDAD